MSRDPRYDILFEPVRIGPHLAKNRFFQVAHCNGMGTTFPKSMAAMREIKAEGGWAVVTTEETEIHPTSDFSPVIEGRLWDDRDIPAFARMTEKLHDHGALAAIELSHSGHRDACLYSREIPLSVSEQPVIAETYPLQARRMDKTDIRAFRQWHRKAAIRASQAGFDIVTVYCRAAASLLGMFLSTSLNDRGDEYGGSLENRVRLLRETLEDTHEAVGDRCAVSLRFTLDEADFGAGPPSGNEARDILAMLAEIPDLWDVNVREWRRDSGPSRFSEEGAQEDLVAFVKQMTSKPVVGVGRFTSPDAMLSQVRRGILDFIGAARPSIADPFLPRKIEEGRLDEIRECIGCNICVTSDFTKVPLRCTQNPTMGEEWRKDWHPEIIAPKASDDAVLIVGGGPAGLECAHALSKRGYAVTLADRAKVLGGRLNHEAKLPGLATWLRVRDHRLQALQCLAHVSLYAESELDTESLLEFGCPNVVLATGARWRNDGRGRFHKAAIPLSGNLRVLTPDDLFAGKRPAAGHVVLYDDDHYYLGGVLAELLRNESYEVTLVTPAADVSTWSSATLEQSWVEERLRSIGVELLEKHAVSKGLDDAVEVLHTRSGARREIACSGLVTVTMRHPNEALYLQLMERQADWQAAGVTSVTRIGDCLAPSTIAAAVYGGHRYAREMDAETDAPVAFRRQLYD